MLAKKLIEVTPVGVMPARAMMALRAESRMLIHEGGTIRRVANATQYELCSDIRARAKEFKKGVDEKFAPIIDPLLAALNASYALRKEVIDPILEVDKRITGMMKEFKQEELEKERREQERRREEAEALRREAEAKRAAELQARTAPMRKLLDTQAEVLETRAKETEDAPAPERVKAAKSGTRIVKKWRVTNLRALMAGIIAGDVPDDVIEINHPMMAMYFKADAVTFAKFPGVEIYEDVSIFNR